MQGIWQSAVGSMLAKITIHTGQCLYTPWTDISLQQPGQGSCSLTEPSLPCQVSSKTKIFTAVSDALEYILGIGHCLGDYITELKFFCEKTLHVSVRTGPCVQEQSEVVKCTLIKFHG